MLGVIKKILTDKGFGFITPEGNGKDVFFHANACDNMFDSLQEGDKVEFGVSEGEKGPAASNLRQV